MVSVTVLASSSAGNCALVSAGDTRILVDAGLSRKETFERLAAADVPPESLAAIVISHEHSDHVAGLAVIAKKLDIPVYISRLTAPAIEWGDYIPKLELFQAGSSFPIGGIDVTSFTVPHDAADPVGFSFQAEGIKISIATDLGYVPDSVRVHLRDSDVLMIESNHDVNMLKVGPYPWSVKQRVMGRLGHLSNDAAASFIRDSLDTRASTVILGHVSEHNNHRVLVEQAAVQALEGRALFTDLLIAEASRTTKPVVFP
ncbi:MAG: MBL fold metallo-hydrolase [Bryobacterales bacterium]|nr:MBL fold metallo-hydrolase [Bryobacterales bacterium]MBV9399829.1 MBL fold metallo-hydrolase [Bryobacterales bacterium]